MALPKKKKTKFDIVTNPVEVGREFLQFGDKRVQELLNNTTIDTTYLPKEVKIEDIDREMKRFLDEGELQIAIDGKKLPVIYLENDRWGEFSKTWKLMDEDKNVPTPYITMKRSAPVKGTRMGNRYNVAQNRTFTYVDVPVFEEGQQINYRFKIPQPTNIDLNYDIRFFTKYRVDVNDYDEKIQNTFASLQGYLFVKEYPMPIMLESNDEADKTIQNIDGDKLFVSNYTILCKGFIQKQENFEITKTTRKPRLGVDLS
jgi:hypothetical protein